MISVRFPTAAAALALLAVLAVSGSALGHAQFVSSTPKPNEILPQPPTMVEVQLSETVEPASARLNVTDSSGVPYQANGTQVSSTDARVFRTSLAGVGPCVYTVVWRAVSAVDGHYTEGSFAFSVQRPDGSLCGVLPAGASYVSPPVSPVEVALRFAAFATLAATVGAIGLAALALDPTLRALDGLSRDKAAAALLLLTRWAGGQGAAFAAFAGGWAAFAVLNAPEGPSSSFVQSLAMRSALGGGAAALMFAAPRATARFAHERKTRAMLFGALALVAAAVGLTSASSHAAASVDWKPLGSLFDFMHLGAVTFWAGALMALVVLREPLRASAKLARGVLRRFSRLAFYAVGAVLIGGFLLSVVQLGEIAALFASTYGLLVLAKVCLFVPMAGLGAHNHFSSLPRLRPKSEDSEAALARIARNVQLETVLGITVLLLASVLTAISPAAPAAAPLPYRTDAMVGDMRVQMEVTPAPTTVGNYSLQFEVYNTTSGLPAGSMGNGSFTLSLVNSTLPDQEVALEGPHVNHYFTNTSLVLGRTGNWRIHLDLLRTGQPDIVATFNILLTAG